MMKQKKFLISDYINSLKEIGFVFMPDAAFYFFNDPKNLDKDVLLDKLNSTISKIEILSDFEKKITNLNTFLFVSLTTKVDDFLSTHAMEEYLEIQSKVIRIIDDGFKKFDNDIYPLYKRASFVYKVKSIDGLKHIASGLSDEKRINVLLDAKVELEGLIDHFEKVKENVNPIFKIYNDLQKNQTKKSIVFIDSIINGEISIQNNFENININDVYSTSIYNCFEKHYPTFKQFFKVNDKEGLKKVFLGVKPPQKIKISFLNKTNAYSINVFFRKLFDKSIYGDKIWDFVFGSFEIEYNNHHNKTITVKTKKTIVNASKRTSINDSNLLEVSENWSADLIDKA